MAAGPRAIPVEWREQAAQAGIRSGRESTDILLFEGASAPWNPLGRGADGWVPGV